MLWNDPQHIEDKFFICGTKKFHSPLFVMLVSSILKKLRKKVYLALCERQEMKLPLNQREKEFLDKYSPDFSDKGR